MLVVCFLDDINTLPLDDESRDGANDSFVSVIGMLVCCLLESVRTVFPLSALGTMKQGEVV
jgi:hypothetical protein